ncbi:neprilysin-2-like [Diachasmimorpha longicaudata]|uniref:neprilysin-2-like n=1 Tax=Diachasmimorpha longicaudata TaxID=58733 RepID=UPI0030B8E5AA
MAILLCIALVIAMYILPAILTMNDKNNTTINDFCSTPICHRAASEILKKMDSDVRPCDNFYRFACGGFLTNTSTPDAKGEVDTLSIIRDKILEELRFNIEEPSTPMELKSLKLAKNLYRSCMNMTAIQAQSSKKLLDDLTELGGWPVLEGDQWDETPFDWIESTYKVRERGYPFDYFLRVTIEPDWKNNVKYVIYLDKAALKVPLEALSFDKPNYMVDIAVMLGAKRDLAIVEMRRLLDFEAEIYSLVQLNEADRYSQFSYAPTTISDLVDLYPSIPWKEYFSRLLPPSVRVGNCEVIIRKGASYIKSLEELMERTPKRVQANYVMWRVVESSLAYMNDQMKERELQWWTGKTEREPRWKECMKVVSQKLPLSLGAVYVRNYFDERVKRNATEMVDDISRQFHRFLGRLDWMDEITRYRARQKGASMTSHIAYPDELLYSSKLEEYYRNLELSDQDYLQGILNISLFDAQNSLGKLGKPFDKNDWTTYGNVARVNITYHPTLNLIDVTAGSLQDMFIGDGLPRYLSYGAIGSTIGHEIAHGFDVNGRWFDGEGNRADWWRPSTMESFLGKSQCVVDQYDNYFVNEVELNLNGTDTQIENIADNGGFNAAYLAYDDWSARNGDEKMLPGLPYTPRQMFWISAANTLCTIQSPRRLELQITEGGRSPAEFRILGTLSNIPAFAEDFKCPLGSGMNPEKKCTIW